MQIKHTWSASSSEMQEGAVEDLAFLADAWNSPLCVSIVSPATVYPGPVEIHITEPLNTREEATGGTNDGGQINS